MFLPVFAIKSPRQVAIAATVVYMFLDLVWIVVTLRRCSLMSLEPTELRVVTQIVI
jgi:hypothetical protein